jgi:hypothetical protein
VRGASAPQPLASRTAWGASAAWGTGRLVGSLVRILPAASWLPVASGCQPSTSLQVTPQRA